MKMKTNSNSYTIIYSAVIVVIVAFLLAFVSKALAPMQDANVKLDEKKQILNSLNIRNLSNEETEATYANFGDLSTALLLLMMTRTLFMAFISIMKVRQPDLVQKSRIIRNGRRNSRVRNFLRMAIQAP